MLKSWHGGSEDDEEIKAARKLFPAGGFSSVSQLPNYIQAESLKKALENFIHQQHLDAHGWEVKIGSVGYMCHVVLSAPNTGIGLRPTWEIVSKHGFKPYSIRCFDGKIYVKFEDERPFLQTISELLLGAGTNMLNGKLKY